LKDAPEPMTGGQSKLHASVAEDIDGNIWDVRKVRYDPHCA